jgi:hypothetical protein
MIRSDLYTFIAPSFKVPKFVPTKLQLGHCFLAHYSYKFSNIKVLDLSHLIINSIGSRLA